MTEYVRKLQLSWSYGAIESIQNKFYRSVQLCIAPLWTPVDQEHLISYETEVVVRSLFPLLNVSQYFSYMYKLYKPETIYSRVQLILWKDWKNRLANLDSLNGVLNRHTAKHSKQGYRERVWGVRKTQNPLAAAAAARAGVTPFIGLPTKPKNIPGPVCRISLQKALNHDITRKIRTSEIECLCLNLQIVLNT